MLDSGFQSPGFRIPQAKNSWIPETGFPYMRRFLALTQRHTALLNRICYLWWDRPDQPDPDPFFTKAAPIWVIIKSWLNWLPSLFFKFSFGGVFMWQGRSVASIYAHKPCLHVQLKYGKRIFFFISGKCICLSLNRDDRCLFRPVLVCLCLVFPLSIIP